MVLRLGGGEATTRIRRPELPRASLCASRAGGSKDRPTTLRPLRQVAVKLLEQHLVLIGVG